jgi:ParB family transcriptional regulator, chromosome partitioning protein
MSESNLLLQPGENEAPIEIPIGLVERCHLQPRDVYNFEAITRIKRSIEESGIYRPIIVRKIQSASKYYKPDWNEDHFEIATGEDVFMVCKDLGYRAVKAFVKEISNKDMLEYALDGTDINSLNPIEKARYFSILSDEFNQNQEDIAKSNNLKQQQVSEYIRLLELPEDVKDFTARAVISLRHARELLKISNSETISRLAKEVIENKLSTRALAEKVKELSGKVDHSDILFHEDIEKIGLLSKKDNKTDEIQQEIDKIDEILIQNGKKWISDDKGIFKKKPKYPFIQPLLSIMSQINSFVLVKPFKRWLRSYLDTKPNLKNMTPEYYLSWFELCLAFPTVCLYVLFSLFPMAALALGCVGSAVLLLKIFEDSQE